MRDVDKNKYSKWFFWCVLAVSACFISNSVTHNYISDIRSEQEKLNATYLALLISVLIVALFFLLAFIFKKIAKYNKHIIPILAGFLICVVLVFSLSDYRKDSFSTSSTSYANAPVSESKDVPEWASVEMEKFKETVFSSSTGRQRLDNWINNIVYKEELRKERLLAIEEASKENSGRPKRLIDHTSGTYEIYTEEDNSWWLIDEKTHVFFNGPYYVVCAHKGDVYYKELLFLEKTAPYKKGVWVKRDNEKSFPKIDSYEEATNSGCVSELLFM